LTGCVCIKLLTSVLNNAWSGPFPADRGARSQHNDPRAPYKVYEGDELKGTYATRAEARRRQQQLESQHSNRHFIIKDRNGDIAV
jgi:hypothetical protein